MGIVRHPPFGYHCAISYLTALAFSASLYGCGRHLNSALPGSWVDIRYAKPEVTIVFRDNGTGSYEKSGNSADSIPKGDFAWRVDGDGNLCMGLVRPFQQPEVCQDVYLSDDGKTMWIGGMKHRRADK